MSNLKKQEQALAQAPSVKAALQVDFVKERFVKNYEAVTGRKDGDNRFQSEVFHYLDLVNQNPKLQSADRFSHFAALVKAGTTGLSFGKEGQLYPILYGNIVKVQIGAHGRRELLRRMPNVKQVLEGQVVLKGDVFKHDKMNGRVLEHVSSEKDVPMTLDNIRAAYVRIIWKDNTYNDVVVYHEELLKAKAKSRDQREGATWNEWPGQMSVKVAYNRAYKLYYSVPETQVTDLKEFDAPDEDDEPVVTQPETKQQNIEEAQVVKDTPAADDIDDFLNK
jgi:recombinational DNA repair protein RecT